MFAKPSRSNREQSRHSIPTVRPRFGHHSQTMLLSLNLDIPGITTVVAERTFWDKVIIIHGQRRWFERRGELQHQGQSVSRHYYDVYRLLDSEAGRRALADSSLSHDCVRHARMFFDRPDFDLASAIPARSPSPLPQKWSITWGGTTTG